MTIVWPPGYKLYNKLFRTAINKLNSCLIKVFYSIYINKIKDNFNDDYKNRIDPRLYLVEKIYTIFLFISLHIVILLDILIHKYRL